MIFIQHYTPISLRLLKQGICVAHVFHVLYTRHCGGGGVESLLHRLVRHVYARRGSIGQQRHSDAKATQFPASEYCY